MQSKIKYKPSRRKIDMSQWNSFEPSFIRRLEKDWFIRKSIVKAEYVDLTDAGDSGHDPDCWKNCEDTVVFAISFASIQEAMDFMDYARFVDELDFIPINKSTFIFRLWWD